jgi:hypothetical protein
MYDLSHFFLLVTPPTLSRRNFVEDKASCCCCLKTFVVDELDGKNIISFGLWSTTKHTKNVPLLHLPQLSPTQKHVATGLKAATYGSPR